jgi:AraC-like DNA-binding protein
MQSEHFQRDRALPFAECRYSQSSQASFKPHMHRKFSIGAVDKGEVLYTVAGKSTTLKPGSLALINPEELHSCNALGSEGRSYYMLYLDVPWCRSLQKSMWEVDTFVKSATIRLDDQLLYQNYCRTMQLLLHQDLHCQEKEQILVELVSTVFLSCCEPQKPGRSEPADIDRLKALLSEDLARDFTLDSLADALGVNPYTLLRYFKAKTGITPHAYRMNCRIEQAKELLRRGTDITETALECGFFDQSHLHRHFKAMTTVTPQEYRGNFVQ